MGNKDARRREAKKPKRKKPKTQPDVNQLAKRLVDATIRAAESAPSQKP